ncbi:MAG: hypothetical protein Q6364_14150 [Candidatus Hermodarchaeota archaeon]|nr:hypothetical protein [Candidatus Hermodarchaeota archaeon]
MKMKMTSVAALLLVALMAVGVSYALWSKTLYIDGTVETGDLNAEFDLTVWSWEALDEFGVPIDPPSKVEDIIVNVYYGADNQEIYVEIEELYPCIYIHIYFDLINPGTVPWIVNNFIQTVPDFPGTVTFSPIGLIGTQLDPGDPPIPMGIVVHLDNTADEIAQYGFSAEIEVVQWNEYPLP